ncbi:hypothetical protein [Citrobacter sedlakii]|uniref:hypothetical protein n=1 Tax=Citrobacter sedlakii TaxID=67826 RepID=UPI001BA9CF87|nr:hypothetical protein [Citrobacter sedlakii]EKJ8216983.1 hypothetical protein [Citrobacter sedlakii]QUC32469.1 hypothetical protein JY391_16080 [Citrobacter sedlakii]
MTTITKESITDTIKGLEQLVNRGIQSIYIDMAIAGMRSLLASLEADPVLYAAEETLAYAKHGELHLTCLSEPMGDAVIPLYTAPPATVCERESVQMFGIGSVFKPQILSIDEVDCDNCAHYQPNVCHGEGCPAAMLQCADDEVGEK